MLIVIAQLYLRQAEIVQHTFQFFHELEYLLKDPETSRNVQYGQDFFSELDNVICDGVANTSIFLHWISLVM